MPPHASDDRAKANDVGLRQVRRRLVMAMLIEFAVLMGVAAIQGFWPGAGAGHGGATLFLALCALALPPAMVALARSVLDAVHDLERERVRLVALYGQARSESLIDALTGLGNHRAFQEELARQLELARRATTSLALLVIDVDDLKKVNDDRGHAAGDELLSTMGRIVTSALRKSDRAFRVGGDEFAVLLPHSDVSSGLNVARRILSSALNGSDAGRSVDPFSVSIGVSAYPLPSSEGHQLYRQADAALYWCKRHGRTSAVAFDPGRHGESADDRSVTELAAAVDEVLRSRALRPVYQPIFSLATGAPIGWEGLVRPAEGAPFSDASTLFGAAEVADRTVELDMACLQIVAAGAGTFEADQYISVNLSPRTIESDLFRPSELINIFRRRAIAPQQVVLELTEREKVDDLEQLRKNVEACRRAGFRLAADDVGAGNAGLRLLSEVHFDMVKIDLSLVQGGVLHDPSHAVLRAIQELAAQWHASTVAEGVETAEQLSVIRKLGIQAGQGYLLARPTKLRSTERVDLDALTSAPWLVRTPAFVTPGPTVAPSPAAAVGGTDGSTEADDVTPAAAEGEAPDMQRVTQPVSDVPPEPAEEAAAAVTSEGAPAAAASTGVPSAATRRRAARDARLGSRRDGRARGARSGDPAR
jgi:diguanylate cyclase (GGDEF)-like protein